MLLLKYSWLQRFFRKPRTQSPNAMARLNPKGNNKAKDQESDSRNQRTKQIIAKSAAAGNRGEASKFD
jgi:hypothetical protein